MVTPESLLLCAEALGACRPVDVDGVDSELLRVLPAGLVVGVVNPLSVDGVGSELLRVLPGGLVVGVAKLLDVDGVGTDVVLVIHLTGLEVLLQAGVEAGVEEVWRPLWWQV